MSAMYNQGQTIKKLEQRIELLLKENDELRKVLDMKPQIHCEINEKGGISINGISKYPIKLFADQLIKLLNNKDTIEEFIKEHEDQLSWLNKKFDM
jgi:hypothetical protein